MDRLRPTTFVCLLSAVALLVLAAAMPAQASAAKRGPWYALQGSADPREADAAKQLGAKVARVEFDISTPVAKMRQTMKMYDDLGIRVLLLAGFPYRVATPREVSNLGNWARAFGRGGELKKPVLHIELGNETGFSYFRTNRRGFEYGKRCKQASQVLKSVGTGVKILCQADDGNTGDGWIRDMYRAVPRLHRYVDGWIVHPYGDYWRKRLNDSLRELKRAGSPSSKKIDITEWGVASADGRLVRYNYGMPRNLSYAKAGTILRGVTSGMRKKLGKRMRYFVIYRAIDGAPVGVTEDPEKYFGMVTNTGALKGALGQTAERLLRSSGAS